MDFRSWFRNSVILIVLMFCVLFLGAVLSINVGPTELVIWLAVLVVGLILVGLGSRKRSAT